MATIQTAIQLYDGVSKPLQNMAAQAEKTATSFETIRDAINAADITGTMKSALAVLNSINEKVESIDGKIEKADSSQEDFNKSMKAGSSAASELASKLASIVATYATLQTLSKVVELSDTMTSTNARLAGVTDDTAAAQQKIMQSANASRASYQDTADAVIKLASNAGDAFNNDLDQVIAFSEAVNKQFVLSGATAEEQSAAMLQLTQAMASGVLRGDELNSIFEQAPGLIQRIANYMDVPIGSVRSMASEGLITADVVKNAMLSSADEISAEFEAMPMTWGQMWTVACNQLYEAFAPVLTQINDLINSESFQTVFNTVVAGIASLSGVASGIISALSSAFDWLAQNMETVKTGLTVVATMAGVVGTIMVVQAAISAAAWLVSYWPFVLIAAVIVGLISYAREMGATFEQIASVIGAAFGAAYAVIYNTFVVPLWNGFALIANFVANCFNDPIAAVKVAFFDMCQTVLGYIKSLAEGIENLLNKIPGVTVDLTSGISNLYASVASAAQTVKDESGWKEYVKSMDYMDISATASSWATKGASIGSSLDNFSLSGLTSSVSSSSGVSAVDYADLIADNTGETAGNTASAAKSLEVTEEDLSYLRDIAEREAINRYTTADVVIHQTNNNSINSELDLDGIYSGLGERLLEEVNIRAEGVHA